MSITAIGSGSLTASLRSTTSASSRLAEAITSRGSGSDSASISADGFAALLRQQRGDGPPPMTDEKAAEIGTRLKEDDADLFSSIDTDQDGTLTASELEAGKDQVRAAMEAKGKGGPPPGGAPPPGPPPGGAPGGSTASSGTEDEDSSTTLEKLLGKSGSDGWSDYQTNLLNSLLQSLAGQA